MQNSRHCLTRLVSNTTIIEKFIESDAIRHFKMPISHGYDSKQKTYDAVRVEGQVGWRLFACEQLLARQRQIGFLHRIVTGDIKWVYYDNPKRRKACGYPGHAFTSTAKPNIHSSKVMLVICWDQLRVVYYKLLKQIHITGDDYRAQLIS